MERNMTTELTIKDIYGEARFVTPINEGSKRVYKLMGDDYVSLKFSVPNPIDFVVGDYVDVEGMGRFIYTDVQSPTANESTGGYDYEIKFENQYRIFKNKVAKFIPQSGAEECTWDLTATASIHMEQIIANLRKLAKKSDIYLYNGTTNWIYIIDDELDAEKYNSAKFVQYDGINILDAITAIAEAFECEWWVENNVFYLGRCQRGEEIELELGKNVLSISSSDTGEKQANRIYVYGSEKNLPANYRKSLIFNVTDVKGNLITDSTRPLKSEWLGGTRVKYESPSHNVWIPQDASINGEDLYTQGGLVKSIFTTGIGTLKQGKYKIDLTEFTSSARWESKNGGVLSKVLYGIGLGYTDTNGSRHEQYYNLEQNINAENQTNVIVGNNFYFEPKSDVEDVVLFMFISIEVDSLDTYKLYISPSGYVKFYSTDTIYQVRDLTITPIGSNQSPIEGVIFNPNFATGDDANWLQLPQGKTLKVGTRYELSPIYTSLVDSGYFSSASFDESVGEDVVVNGIAKRRLSIPESYPTPYIDAKDGMTDEEAIEDVVILEDVYPHREEVIDGEPTFVMKDDSEETPTGTIKKEYPEYTIRIKGFNESNPFKDIYIVEGETLQMTFSSGILNGWTFDLQVNKDNTFTIVRDEAQNVPNTVLKPANGDKFVLTNFDVSLLLEQAVENSEQELLAKGLEYVAKVQEDAKTYDCTMMNYAMAGYDGENIGVNPLLPSLYLGRKVKLKSPIITGGERASRVIGYEYNLDMPYDNAVVSIGEKSSYSRIGAIEDKVDNLALSLSKGGGSIANTTIINQGGNSVYLIGQNDSTTPPADTNTFSALWINANLLKKNISQKLSYVWSFIKGAKFGSFAQGNSGAKIDENGDAEFGDVNVRGTAKASHVVADRANDGAVLSSVGFDASAIGFGYGILKDGFDYRLAIDYLTVRKGMTVAELVIQEYKSVGGVLVLSACNGEIDSAVQDGDSAYWMINIKDWDKHSQFRNGDIIRCSRWDDATNEYVSYIGVVDASEAEEEVASQHIYVHLVSGDATPQVGDNLVQFGSTTDTLRQGLIIISTEEGKPNITLYDGLNSADVNMLDKMTARLGNLNGIVKDGKTLSGYGLWTNNLYLGSKAEEVFKELINIGGRNYALGTSTPFTNNISTTASDWQDMRMYFAKGLKAGDLVNVSFDWSAVGANNATINKIKLRFGYGTETSISQYHDGEELLLSTATGAYNCQMAVPDGVTEDTTIHVWLRVFSNSVTSITVSHLMLQKGQGDWQPAPEDALNALAEYKEEISHEFEVTNQGLSSVQKSVTSLQTGGGRNLLLKTNQGTTNWSCITNSQNPPTISDADGGGVAFDYINGNTATSWEIYAFDIRPELIKQGHTYTLTVDVLEMSTSSGIVFHCQIANPDATGQLIPDTSADKPINTDEPWTKLTFTFTATASGNKDGGQRVRLFVPQNKIGVLTYIEFRNLKLEEGNVATAYTAAPEDYADTVAEQAKETAIQQTKDEINIEAYAKTTDVGGMIEVATADIKIEAGKISQSVSDLKTSVDGQISGLESKIEQTASNISLKVKELGVSNLNYAYGTGKKVEITSLANINNQSVYLYDVTGLIGGDTVSVSFKIRIKNIIFDTLNGTRTARIFPQLSAEYGYYALGITITADTFKDIQIDAEGYLNAHVSSEGIVIPTTAPAQKDTVGYIYVRLDYIDSEVDAEGNDIGIIEISELKVEKGDECTAWTARTYDLDKGLLDTGIDIENKKITVTANQFEVRNNNGDITASVDEDGRLSSNTFIAKDGKYKRTTINENFDGFGRWYYPNTDIPCIEIGWDEKQSSFIRVYDKSGNMAWKLDTTQSFNNPTNNVWYQIELHPLGTDYDGAITQILSPHQLSMNTYHEINRAGVYRVYTEERTDYDYETYGITGYFTSMSEAILADVPESNKYYRILDYYEQGKRISSETIVFKV